MQDSLQIFKHKKKQSFQSSLKVISNKWVKKLQTHISNCKLSTKLDNLDLKQVYVRILCKEDFIKLY